MAASGTNVTASLRWIEKKSFVARTGTGHSLVIDLPLSWGGENAGPYNAELVLIALGGCAGMDVANILAKQRIAYDRIDIHVAAHLADARPARLESYDLTFAVHGTGVPPSAVDAAIALSMEKYCVIAHSLAEPVTCHATLNGEPTDRYP